MKDGHWIFGQKHGHSRLWRQLAECERSFRKFHKNWCTLIVPEHVEVMLLEKIISLILRRFLANKDNDTNEDRQWPHARTWSQPLIWDDLLDISKTSTVFWCQGDQIWLLIWGRICTSFFAFNMPIFLDTYRKICRLSRKIDLLILSIWLFLIEIWLFLLATWLLLL